MRKGVVMDAVAKSLSRFAWNSHIEDNQTGRWIEMLASFQDGQRPDDIESRRPENSGKQLTDNLFIFDH